MNDTMTKIRNYIYNETYPLENLMHQLDTLDICESIFSTMLLKFSLNVESGNDAAKLC